jgi:hypothetical protein
VLAAVYELVEAGGAVALVGRRSGTARHRPTRRPPPIPHDAIEGLIGSVPRVVPRPLEDTFETHWRTRRSASRTSSHAPGRADIVRTIDEVVAGYLSMSFAAPDRFGDRLDAFLADLVALLAEASPGGRFHDWPARHRHRVGDQARVSAPRPAPRRRSGRTSATGHLPRVVLPDGTSCLVDGARRVTGRRSCVTVGSMGRARRAAALVAMALVVATSCTDPDGSTRAAATSAPPASAAVRIGPLTPTDPGRIPPEQVAAIDALAAAASPQPPDPHTGHHGHGGGAPVSTSQLTSAERETFEAQWAAAVAAVTGLDTPEEATASGYTRAAVFGPGVGVHWVNWTLIDAPFDPARPAMLLFDERRGRNDLIGFSYWLRTDHPDGFAGMNDVWHRHTDLCIVNGWVDRERSASVDDCAGSFLAGADLWMLHAWVVPELPNRWGDFSVLHPALCPPAAGAPDIARCFEPRSGRPRHDEPQRLGLGRRRAAGRAEASRAPISRQPVRPPPSRSAGRPAGPRSRPRRPLLARPGVRRRAFRWARFVMGAPYPCARP